MAAILDKAPVILDKAPAILDKVPAILDKVPAMIEAILPILDRVLAMIAAILQGLSTAEIWVPVVAALTFLTTATLLSVERTISNRVLILSMLLSLGVLFLAGFCSGVPMLEKIKTIMENMSLEMIETMVEKLETVILRHVCPVAIMVVTANRGFRGFRFSAMLLAVYWGGMLFYGTYLSACPYSLLLMFKKPQKSSTMWKLSARSWERFSPRS